jgi:hypothetical protein
MSHPPIRPITHDLLFRPNPNLARERRAERTEAEPPQYRAGEDRQHADPERDTRIGQASPVCPRKGKCSEEAESLRQHHNAQRALVVGRSVPGSSVPRATDKARFADERPQKDDPEDERVWETVGEWLHSSFVVVCMSLFVRR